VIEIVTPEAIAGKLVTFGVCPTGPETGYGYIKAGSPVKGSGNENAVLDMDCFVEKPDKATAQGYVASGDYFWNSGMFMFTARQYLAELVRCSPEMAGSCRKVYAQAVMDPDFIRLDKNIFSACPSDSIDYAVMEKTADAVVCPLNAGWCDVGSWSALYEIGRPDYDGNVLKGDVYLHDTKNCYIFAEERLIAAAD